jgi:hypothetical protein
MQISDVMPVATELPGLITTSAMSVAIIQWLKNTKWVPFINQHSAGINRMVGWGSALLSATGLHYTFDAHTGTLTLTGLTLMTIAHAVWDTTKSYAFNWLIYNGMVKGRAADVTAISEGVRAIPVATAGAVKAGVEAAQEGTKG